MFKIYGGANKFKQWTKDNKLIMDELPIGADVMFYNDPNEDDPLITEVYEIRDEEDNVFRVCDVPNILLTETKRIKVRIPKVVKGLYGNLYKSAGRNEMIFEVEPAEKPSDYVYEKTVTNTIDPKHLPEGYPYKESRVTVDVSSMLGSGAVLCKVSDDVPANVADFTGIKIWKNGEGINVTPAIVNEMGYVDTVLCCVIACVDNATFDLDGMYLTIPEAGVYLLKAESAGICVTGVAWDSTASEPDITWDGVVETIHPMSSEFLPTSVPAIKSASVGQVPKVAAVDENGVPTKWEAGEAKSYSEESWTFTLEDGGTVTKKVAVGE